MIALADQTTTSLVPTWHAKFLSMLPVITRYASIAFRSLRPEAKSEAVQEVIANSFVAFRRLHELGKLDVAYASALARYGVAQVRSGRQVGTKLNTNDVSSTYAQKKSSFALFGLIGIRKSKDFGRSHSWKTAGPAPPKRRSCELTLPRG